MRVHVLQHVAFEGLGQIETWLTNRGAQITTTRFFEEPSLPPLEGIDLVVALGGPMSVNDESELPWLVAEKAFVRGAITSGRAVLGVCLGAQLMASSLGARVYPGAHAEIGWFPITRVGQSPDSFTFPDSLEVLHWHGETFELPPDAVHLARSAGCENQAFQLGRRAIGLQFHLEMTQASVARIVECCSADLVPGRYVQTAEHVTAHAAEGCALTHPVLGELLGYLTQR